MGSTQSRDTIAELVNAELGLLRQFLVCLQREQALLVARDIDGLNSVVAEKSRLADELAAAAQLRQRTLAAAGCPADRAGIEQWLAGHGAVGDWQALVALARKARATNETNGKLIAGAMQHNQRALAALAAADSALLYGPDGRERQASSARDFGVA